MTSETRKALILAHQRNIERHCRLLTTELTDHEHRYIERRIAEERAELERLVKLNQVAEAGGVTAIVVRVIKSTDIESDLESDLPPERRP